MDTRPEYETPAHRASEHEILMLLGPLWDAFFKKLPVKYGLDYAVIIDDKVKGFIEIKVRNLRFNDFPTYMISLHKVIAARELARETGLPCHLVIKFIDRTAYLDMSSDFTIFYSGRTDRGDWQDEEPMALFNCDLFKRIE
jgi:hypothetical protein